MTQDERWLVKYNEVKNFIDANKRNPRKHRIEEHLMLNWIKHNKKMMKAGEMKTERIEMFEKLLAKMEEYKRVNQ